MRLQPARAPLLGVLLLIVPFLGCVTGPSASGSFDRSFTVSGPVRLELANASGDVSITGSSDGAVHVHGSVRSSGLGFENPQKRLDQLIASPPLEQRGDTIRVGKDLTRIRNVSISYVIEVPRETEVSATVASGSQIIQNLRGPVKTEAASGSIRVQHIERTVQLTTLSGSIQADDIGGELRASSASGSVAASNIKGDVEISALSGSTQVSKAAGRIEADSASGSVDIQDAAADVKAHGASGTISVRGNPGPTSYWDLKTASGTVQISVPPNSNFHLSAEAVSGEIKTDIPIVIEEQGKHSLRAHVGNNGGRVEIHTISGQIRIRAS